MAQGWIPDDATNSCMNCNKKFDLLNRKHHCRACERVFCQKCSSKSIPILSKKKKDPQRVCDHCYKVEGKRNIWVQRVDTLKGGCMMVIVSTFTSSARFVQLDQSEKYINIMDAKTKKTKNSIDMTSITAISEGKITSNLRKSNVPSMQCFAIIASSTHEFECQTAKDKENWCKALNSYLAYSKETDPAELKKQAQQKYFENMTDKKKAKEFQKNQAKRDSMRKKWGLKE